MASVERVLPLARCLSAAYKPMVSGHADDLARVFADGAARERMLYVSKVRGPHVARWLAEPRYRSLVQEAVEELLGLPAAALVQKQQQH